MLLESQHLCRADLEMMHLEGTLGFFDASLDNAATR